MTQSSGIEAMPIVPSHSIVSAIVGSDRPLATIAFRISVPFPIITAPPPNSRRNEPPSEQSAFGPLSFWSTLAPGKCTCKDRVVLANPNTAFEGLVGNRLRNPQSSAGSRGRRADTQFSRSAKEHVPYDTNRRGVCVAPQPVPKHRVVDRKATQW